ncbi:hypothetical protein HDU91_002934, partial [Kappamyces sp. JEL0680]
AEIVSELSPKLVLMSPYPIQPFPPEHTHVHAKDAALSSLLATERLDRATPSLSKKTGWSANPQPLRTDSWVPPETLAKPADRYKLPQ